MVTIVGDPDGVPESGVRLTPGDFDALVASLRPLLNARLFAVDGWGIGREQADGSVVITDPAAMLAPAREPVEWSPRDEAGDEEC